MRALGGPRLLSRREFTCGRYKSTFIDFQSTFTLRARPVDDPDEETKHPLSFPQGNRLVQLETNCHSSNYALALLDRGINLRRR